MKLGQLADRERTDGEAAATNADEAAIVCNCAQLRKAARRISRYYDQCLADTGLRATQFALLGHLKRRGDLKVSELAALIEADRATMGHNLRPLERDGLIKLARSKTDGRARVVTLTAAGRKAFAKGVEGWKHAQKTFERSFGASDAAALRAMLSRVVTTELGPTE
jgi:DNA-binding MarR family transcriptional regulator